jgi:hypothetical protein
MSHVPWNFVLTRQLIHHFHVESDEDCHAFPPRERYRIPGGAAGRPTMKKLRWLPWQGRKKSSDTKSEAVKKLRQRTDQRMKQQEVQKDQRGEAESSRADGVHRDQ